MLERNQQRSDADVVHRLLQLDRVKVPLAPARGPSSRRANFPWVAGVMTTALAAFALLVGSLVLNSPRAAAPAERAEGAVLVATLDARGTGTIQLVRPSTYEVLAELHRNQHPEAEWDPRGLGFYVIATELGDRAVGVSKVTFFDLATFSERDVVKIDDRFRSPFPITDTLAISRDGDLLFTYEYRVLGDDAATYWINGWTTDGGRHRGRVSLPSCGPALLHPAQGRRLYVTCLGSSQLVSIQTDTWAVERTVPLMQGGLYGQTLIAAANLAPDANRYVAVTGDMRVIVVDTSTFEVTVRSDWRLPPDPSSNMVQDVLFGQMVIARDGSRIWIGTGYSPSEIAARNVTMLDLAESARKDWVAPGVRALTRIGDQVVFGTATHLRALDSDLELQVVRPAGPKVRVWRVIAAD